MKACFRVEELNARYLLIQTVPASMRLAMRSAASMSADQTEAPS